jgi:hypothetical protein
MAFLVFALCACGEDRRFEQQFENGAREVAEVLVRHGECPSEDRCGGIVFFWQPISGGFEVIIYGIGDEKILNEITGIFARQFLDTAKCGI